MATTPTLFERTLQHIAGVLSAAVPSVQGRVYRGLVDEVDPALAPFIVLRRTGTSPGDAVIHGEGAHDLGFQVSAIVTGPAWETDADALHQAAHVALVSDGLLGQLDLTLGPTEATGRAGEVTTGAISAAYTVTVQPDVDLT